MQSSSALADGWRQASHRRRLVLELTLLTVLYVAYSLGRAWVSSEPSGAVRRGRELLHWEQLVHLDIEPVANQGVSAIVPLAVVGCFLYATLHYVLTPAALMWVFRRRPLECAHARSSLVLATAAGLLVFALAPVAPPRLLPGGAFIDTMAEYASYGWWSDAGSAVRGMQGLTNQYATLPSLHIGWAVWVALVVWRATPSRRLRALAVSYPLLIAVVVVVTGNHYLIDVAAGAVLMLACDGLVTVASRARKRRSLATLPAPAATGWSPISLAIPVAPAVCAASGVSARESEQQPAVASLLVAEADDAPPRSRLPRQRE
ncbi:MAG: phosphatase PAP2 family protein [Nocardioidaceae bacterium]